MIYEPGGSGVGGVLGCVGVRYLSIVITFGNVQSHSIFSYDHVPWQHRPSYLLARRSHRPVDNVRARDSDTPRRA